MAIRKSDMLAYLCNECAKQDKKRVFLTPPEMHVEGIEEPKYCPYCGVGEKRK